MTLSALIQKREISIFFSIVFILSSSSAWAKSKDKDDKKFKEVCTGAQTAANPGIATQWQQYCQAAEDAKKGASTDNTLFVVYAGVAAVCTGACVMQFTGYGAAQASVACSGTGIAGAATDAILTKNYTSALASVAMGGIGAYQGVQNVTAGTAPQGISKIMPCVSAAMAAGQSFMRKSNADKQNKTAKENLADAEKLKGQKAQLTQNTSGMSGLTPPRLPSLGSSGSGGGGGGEGGGGGTSGITGGTTQAASDAPVSDCGRAASGGTFKDHVACALAQDQKLAPIVSHPNFLKDLQTTTGLTPDEFLEKAETLGPTGAIGSVSSGFGPGGAEKLQAALQQVAEHVASGEVDTDSAYAGGGGGGGGGGGSGDSGMSAALAGLMEKLNPKDEKDSNPGKNDGLKYANAHFSRDPAAEDKEVSIFDRISYRYARVSPRLLDLPQPKAAPPLPR